MIHQLISSDMKRRKLQFVSISSLWIDFMITSFRSQFLASFVPWSTTTPPCCLQRHALIPWTFSSQRRQRRVARRPRILRCTRKDFCSWKKKLWFSSFLDDKHLCFWVQLPLSASQEISCKETRNKQANKQNRINTHTHTSLSISSWAFGVAFISGLFSILLSFGAAPLHSTPLRSTRPGSRLGSSFVLFAFF